MQSFRTEIENPVVSEEIIELEKKIAQFKGGLLDLEKFRTLRLARGIYGQRQPGVQMVRIKFPLGIISALQLKTVADLADEFSNGKLHLTTRQDIQIHYVSLDDTPVLWEKLSREDITLREACGNTVRNVTASPEAGTEPGEPFDITPHAYEVFRYFLRKPFGQDLGRKFKVAFSSTEKDTALTFIHDLGFIPVLRAKDGVPVKGFQVWIGGGLGAQPIPAKKAFDFLPEEKVIPFVEAVIRYFDRAGERNQRNRARLKYLVQDEGLDVFLGQVQKEIAFSGSYPIPEIKKKEAALGGNTSFTVLKGPDYSEFLAWKKTNTFEQKQRGWFRVNILIPLGNISSKQARFLADIIAGFSADDARISIQQSLILRFVPAIALYALFRELKKQGFAGRGAEGLPDIVACPGTDTCNLGITNATGTARVLAGIIRDEFPGLEGEADLKIKISGCMNSCAQHGIAQIGFHGSTIKFGNATLPALQILLGGGQGSLGDKILKLPSRIAPDALRKILNHFLENRKKGEAFNAYYQRFGKAFFYGLLKPLSEVDAQDSLLFVDFEREELFKTEIGVGECAGVKIDLVATLITEAGEKIEAAKNALNSGRYADSLYHSYSSVVQLAKARLLSIEKQPSTQEKIIRAFEEHFNPEAFGEKESFSKGVLAISSETPGYQFAQNYLESTLRLFEKFGSQNN